MNVSDVMRRAFATIKSDAPLLEAANLLIETNQRGLPVVDHEGVLVGVISEGDFLHRTELEISPPPGHWLEDCDVSQIVPVFRTSPAQTPGSHPEPRCSPPRFDPYQQLQALDR